MRPGAADLPEPPDAAGGTILYEPVCSQCALRARTASDAPSAREATRFEPV
jgi:hypothetical protein